MEPSTCAPHGADSLCASDTTAATAKSADDDVNSGSANAQGRGIAAKTDGVAIFNVIRRRHSLIRISCCSSRDFVANENGAVVQLDIDCTVIKLLLDC